MNTLPPVSDTEQTEARAAVAPAGEPITAPTGYELQNEIGRGGMGVVYRAHDREMHRDVAVKVLQVRLHASAAATRRFLDEARITGQLQHPGIPPVHQVGALPDGRPFLAMKLIQGRTLADLMSEPGNLSRDRGRFIAVFEQIVQAVGYAHENRVVHRDLKPGNVMVGAFGEVQVMDWGLAKVLADQGPGSAEGPASETDSYISDGGETAPGSVLGTPQYMSREQAIGAVDQVDERSDVFGLGGILCAILTGYPPYRASSSEAVQQMAATADLGNAFERLDGCAAEPELVDLCKRCLSPEKEARPENGGAVAREVAELRVAAAERARRAELEQVRVRSQAEGDRKRARLRLLSVGLFGLLFAAGVAFAWWQNKLETDRKFAAERDEAERLRLDGDRKAAEARADAEADFKARQARQGIDAALALAADLRSRYRFMFAEAPLAQAAELARSGAPERLAEVEQARADLKFVVALDDVRYRKWVIVMTGGGKYQFDEKSTAPRYRAAFAAHGLDLTALEPDEASRRIAASGVKAELVAAVDDWAVYEDEPLRSRLLGIIRRADPGRWTDRLREPANRRVRAALQQLATEADPKQTAPAALSTLATLMWRQNMDPKPLLIAARTVYPGDFDLAFALGQYYAWLKDPRMIGAYEAARALRPENVAVWINLGSALELAGDLDGALAADQKVIELEPQKTVAHINMGLTLVKLRKFNEALETLQMAAKLEPKNSRVYDTIGQVLQEMRKWQDAIVWHRKAIAIDPGDALAHSNLASALRHIGSLPEAISAHQKAIELAPNSAEAHSDFGLTLAAIGKSEEAIREYRLAIKLNDKLAPPHSNLGIQLLNKGDVDGAITSFNEALRRNPNSARTHFNLGNAFREKGELDKAIASFRRAIELDPTLPVYLNLGNAIRARKEYDAAILAYNEAIKLNPRDAMAYTNMGLVYADKGDIDQAIAQHRKAIEVDPRYISAHFNLGLALRSKGNAIEDIAAYKKAIEADADNAELYARFGRFLQGNGRFQEALPHLMKAHELGSKRPGWQHPSARWIMECRKDLANPQNHMAPPPREVSRP